MRNTTDKKNFIIYTLAAIALAFFALFFAQHAHYQTAYEELYEELYEAQQGEDLAEQWQGLNSAWVTCNRFVQENDGFGECHLEAHDEDGGFWVEVTASPVVEM